MLSTTSKHDAWKTREPADYSPVIEQVDEALADGDYDADVEDALRQAGSVGVEELVAALLRSWEKLHGPRRAERLVRDLMLDTPTGRRFRERLIDEAIDELRTRRA